MNENIEKYFITHFTPLILANKTNHRDTALEYLEDHIAKYFKKEIADSYRQNLLDYIELKKLIEQRADDEVIKDVIDRMSDSLYVSTMRDLDSGKITPAKACKIIFDTSELSLEDQKYILQATINTPKFKEDLEPIKLKVLDKVQQLCSS